MAARVVSDVCSSLVRLSNLCCCYCCWCCSLGSGALSASRLLQRRGLLARESSRVFLFSCSHLLAVAFHCLRSVNAVRPSGLGL